MSPVVYYNIRREVRYMLKMQAEMCKIMLVCRTIGAERGRAARGRP